MPVVRKNRHAARLKMLQNRVLIHSEFWLQLSTQLNSDVAITCNQALLAGIYSMIKYRFWFTVGPKTSFRFTWQIKWPFSNKQCNPRTIVTSNDRFHLISNQFNCESVNLTCEIQLIKYNLNKCPSVNVVYLQQHCQEVAGRPCRRIRRGSWP